MSDPSLPLAKPLLKEAVPHGAHFSAKVLILLTLFAGLGFTMLMSFKPYTHEDGRQHLAVQEPAMKMQAATRATGQQLLPLGRSQHFLPSGNRQQRWPFASLHQTFAREAPIRAAPIIARRRSPVAVHAYEIDDDLYKEIVPVKDMVLVKVAKTESESKGGVLLPEMSIQKLTGGSIIAIGEKTNTTLKVGDLVYYGESGTIDLKWKDEDYVLMKADYIIGTLPGESIDLENLPQLVPNADRVLCRVTRTTLKSKGGVLLAGSQDPPASLANVIRIGTGSPGSTPTETEKQLKPGDTVMFAKSAGEPLKMKDGSKYVVIRANEILVTLGEF